MEEQISPVEGRGGHMVVHSDHLRHNAAALRMRFGRNLICVVKGNGYGLGLEVVTRALAQSGERHFAVGTGGEAAAVLAAASDVDVLVLEPELGAYARRPHPLARAVLAVGDHSLEALGEHAAMMSPARIQIEVDCGVGRGGIPVDELLGSVDRIRRRKHVEVVGFVAHFPQETGSSADRRRILDFLRRAEERTEATVSIGGSDVLRWADEAPEHWPVRVGRSLYGVAPRWLESAELLSAWAWVCRALPVPGVRRAGYRSRKIGGGAAVHLGVGFADGLPPAAATRWPILVGGAAYRVVEVFMLSSIAVPAGSAQAAEANTALLSGRLAHDEVPIRRIANELDVPTTAVLMMPRPTTRIVM